LVDEWFYFYVELLGLLGAGHLYYYLKKMGYLIPLSTAGLGDEKWSNSFIYK
jgi:hypothetical protein